MLSCKNKYNSNCNHGILLIIIIIIIVTIIPVYFRHTAPLIYNKRNRENKTEKHEPTTSYDHVRRRTSLRIRSRTTSYAVWTLRYSRSSRKIVRNRAEIFMF